MASRNNQEDKRGVTGGFGLFLVAVMVAVMLLQNLFEAKSAKVSFSYQVEHLVNLGLLRPDSCKKTATSANLVSFSGRFRDSLSDSARQRFRYLELVSEYNELFKEYQQAQQSQLQMRQLAMQAADLYWHLRGGSLPMAGF